MIMWPTQLAICHTDAYKYARLKKMKMSVRSNV